MKTPGPVLPTKAAEPTPDYLSSTDGNWVFDKETGSFMWVPTDNVGQQFNQNSPILQEPAKTVLPNKITPRWEDGSGIPQQ